MAGAQVTGLDGRVAVVTGGAKGLGLGIARRLAASGAKLVLWDLDRDRLAEAERELGALTAVVDVADEAAVNKAAAALERVDILVNNAGIGGPNRDVTDIALAEWQLVVAVNLTGTFLCTRAILPKMKAAKYGRIVNIASANGKEGNPRTSPYSAAKAGVIAFTKSVAKEVATCGILVNCVTPASIKTDFLAARSQAHLDAVLARIPIGRFAEIDEVAAMVAWLCSDEVSYSTGAAFDLSGGRTPY